jgi:polyphosphate kinase
MTNKRYFNREQSWLSFNYRVLQEAADKSNPLYERIKFLAIYSSNLDEFFRVRVASLRSLLRLKKKSRETLDFDPLKLLKIIYKTVDSQQEEFGLIFREQILPELKTNGINLINETELNEEQKVFAHEYFQENVVHRIQPILLIKNKIKPFLKNRRLYFAVKLAPKKELTGKPKLIKHKYALVEIPSSELPRFIELPGVNEDKFIIFLDDIIRVNLHEIFNAFNIVEAFSIKLNRDADLYIDDEFTGNLYSKIKKGLSKRETGPPSRFLYDKLMPKDFLKLLKYSLELDKEDLMPGGKYHNYFDFFSFPNPTVKGLENEPLTPLINKHPERDDLFGAIRNGDQCVQLPYHSYDYIIEFLNQAASDPLVKSIKITQYRAAKNSAVVNALLKASENGKEVIAFIEIKARFDEESNLQWAEDMENKGIKVYYSFPGLKVHAKLALVEREENNEIVDYCYLATGNFNEKTAKIYSDFGLFTTNKNITKEVDEVFKYLSGSRINYNFEHLLVARFNMRKGFTRLIDNEIENAAEGKEAKILLKMNSLEDKKMINKLYEASNAGVNVKIIVRGICCLVPGVKGLSENIEVISIVDRFLEHARFYVFYNDGNQLIYAGSADWMKRNLSRRIEVAFSVSDKKIGKEILDILDLQWKDNVKARIIDKKNTNRFRELNSEERIQSQLATYNYLKSKN